MKFLSYTLALCVALAALPAYAQEGPDYLSLSVGYFDILDDEDALDLRAEYRSNHDYGWGIKPWGGVEFTSDSSIWAGAGLYKDIDLGDNLYLIPNFGVGLYAQGSSDLDLGSAIEFRSQLELAYEFEGLDRVGVSFGHLSNASISSRNPGTEVLNIYYHVPLSHLGF